MERFSVYPAGVQGVALAVLRVSLACTLFHPMAGSLAARIPDIVLYIAAVCLLAGGLTRVVATCLAGLGTPDLMSFALPGAAYCLEAVALALLGSGAYSVDARLFGRRVIRIRRPDHVSRSSTDG